MDTSKNYYELVIRNFHTLESSHEKDEEKPSYKSE